MTQHGFKTIRTRVLDELSTTLYELEHERTGAKLVWYKHAEQNKTFDIAFSTQPTDDTGVFHILEHSVLNGSEKYPVKEPFVELMKSSLNTFVNAITFPEMTMYPISSSNDKDFINLMRVYLDAVFFPAIYTRPETFRQEGWHYEIDEQGKARYNGVVFNEMKGCFATPDALAELWLLRGLFPNSTYGFDSGGYPISIPDLSYEQFIALHRKLYSPSNCYIVLDGDLNLDEVLGIIDSEYLSRFERGERAPLPTLQPPVDTGTRRVYYEIGAEEQPEGKVRLSWGRALGSNGETEKLIALQLIAEALTGNNHSPLCRAVLSQGLAEEVKMYVYRSTYQPYGLLEVKNLREEDADKVEALLFGELERIATEGLDREQMEAIMARSEFKSREREPEYSPTGIRLAIETLHSWMNGGAPEATLVVGDMYDKLRKKLYEGWFELLIRRSWLDNPHRCKVELYPSADAGEQRRKAEEERLANEVALWTDEDRQRILREQQELVAAQNREDTPEQLATIPRLDLADIPEEPEYVPVHESVINGVRVLTHELTTAGISYITLYFDVEGYSESELSALSLMTKLWGKLGTDAHSADKLIDLTKLLTGSLNLNIKCFAPENSMSKANAKLCVGFSALARNTRAAVELVCEILTRTNFNDVSAVTEVLKQRRQELQQYVMQAGSAVASTRCEAQFSAAGVVDDCCLGYGCYLWHKAADEGQDWQALTALLSKLAKQVINRSGFVVSIVGADEALTSATAELLRDKLPETTEIPHEITAIAPRGITHEGIRIPADTAFSALGVDLNTVGLEHSGISLLAGQIVSLSYLWNVVRVQGGAYGTGLMVKDTGYAACYSYRDPTVARSIECGMRSGEFLRDYCTDEADLVGPIIGTISETEPYRTAKKKGIAADSDYFRGISYERRCEIRRQILNADVSELRTVAIALDKALKAGGSCVIAGQAKLDECKLDSVSAL